SRSWPPGRCRRSRPRGSDPRGSGSRGSDPRVVVFHARPGHARSRFFFGWRLGVFPLLVCLPAPDRAVRSGRTRPRARRSCHLRRCNLADAMWDELTARLEGRIVVLEPLQARHEEGLFAVAQNPEIWRWLAPIGDSREYFSAWFAMSLAESEAGTEGVFATIDRASDRPIGSTRYLNVREAHRGVEIGWTWLSPSMWGAGANVEAKLLMLEHAFERLECMRVEFKTDARNER